MNIKPIVYDSLTARQRVIATLEASARDDDKELERLRISCQYKNYKQRDAAWSDTIDALLDLALATEYDIAIAALQWFMYDENPVFLARMAAIQQGWFDALAEYGIDGEMMMKAGVPRSNEVALLFRIQEKMSPPDADMLKKCRDVVAEILREKVSPMGGLG